MHRIGAEVWIAWFPLTNYEAHLIAHKEADPRCRHASIIDGPLHYRGFGTTIHVMWKILTHDNMMGWLNQTVLLPINRDGEIIEETSRDIHL